MLNTNKINTACKTLFFKSLFYCFYIYFSNFFLFSTFLQGRQTSWRICPIFTCELKSGFRVQGKYSSDQGRYLTIISFFLNTCRKSPVICFYGQTRRFQPCKAQKRKKISSQDILNNTNRLSRNHQIFKR